MFALAAGSVSDYTNLYIGVLGVVAAALTAFAVIYKGRHGDDMPADTHAPSQWRPGDVDRRIDDIGRRDDEQDRRMGAIEEIARRLDDRVERTRTRIDNHLDGTDGWHRRRNEPDQRDITDV